MAVGNATEIKALMLQVDASVELARRNLNALAGDVQRFADNSDKSLAQAETGYAKLGKTVGMLTGALAVVGASVGVSTFLEAGRNALQFADDMDAASQKAGISVERYQTLTEAFRTLEVDTEQVDKTLKVLTDTLGAVQSGTAAKGVTEALDKMGVTAQITNGTIKDGAGLLDAIAASAGKFKTEAEFTSAVVDVLGRKLGVDVAAAIRDGGTALHDLEEKMRSAGLVMDKEMVSRLADANEAIDKFAANSKIRLTIWAGETIGFLQKVAAQLGFFVDDTDRAAQKLAAMKGGREITGEYLGGLIQTTRPASDNSQRDGLLNEFVGSLPISLTSGRFRAGFETSPAAGTAGSGGGSGGGFGGGSSRRSGRSSGPEPSFADIRLGDVESGSTMRPDLAGNGPLVDLEKAYSTVVDLRDLLPEINIASILPADEQERIERFAADFNHDLSTGLADAIVYGDDLGDTLVNTFKRAAAEALSSGLFDILSGGGGGIGGGMGGGTNILSSLFGGFFADGGNPPVGKVSVVGERGAELFVPKVSGTIIPNHMLGGASISVSVDARGANDPAAVELAAQRAVLAAAPAIIAASQSRAVNTLTRPSLPGSRG